MQGDLDKFRVMVIRSLRYYQTMLNDLLNNEEGERFQGVVNPFGNYLADTVKRADKAARDIKEDPTEIITFVKQDRHRAVVREALAFYISELRKREEIIREGLGVGGTGRGRVEQDNNNSILSFYETERGIAEEMKQTIDEEEVQGVTVEEDEPIFSVEANNVATNNNKRENQ
jgi:hypothetical protein